MTLDEYALMVAMDVLEFKWIFIPETRCIRIWTIVKNDKKVIDLRDIPEEELYENMTKKDLLREACKERPKTIEGIRKAQKECALYPVKEIE